MSTAVLSRFITLTSATITGVEAAQKTYTIGIDKNLSNTLKILQEKIKSDYPDYVPEQLKYIVDSKIHDLLTDSTKYQEIKSNNNGKDPIVKSSDKVIVDPDGSLYLSLNGNKIELSNPQNPWKRNSIESDSFQASETPKSKTKGVVILDPGHGKYTDRKWNDPGAVVLDENKKVVRTEEQTNLEISNKLAKELEAKGYTVVVTRQAQDVGTTKDHDGRKKMLNNLIDQYPGQAVVVIDVQANGSESSNTRGLEFYYAKQDEVGQNDEKLATHISQSFQQAIKLPDSDLKGFTAKDPRTEDKTQHGTLRVCHLNCTGMLVEFGYLSNSDGDFIALHETKDSPGKPDQYDLVRACASGIDNYFNEINGTQEITPQ